jgi:hypothetical protein
MEGVKSRRKRISQNTPRTRVGRAAMRLVGRGRGGSAAWAGRQAKAGWGAPEGWSGRLRAEAQWGEEKRSVGKKRNGPRLGSRAESEEEGFLN